MYCSGAATALRSVERLAACFSERSFSAVFFAAALRSATAFSRRVLRSATAFFAAASFAAALSAAVFVAAFFAAISFAVGTPSAIFSAAMEDLAAVGCASLCPPVAMAVAEPAATSTAVASLWERVMRMTSYVRQPSQAPSGTLGST
ncbi:hypothetical protein SMICM17S_06337 [Streptomyces microflavus]